MRLSEVAQRTLLCVLLVVLSGASFAQSSDELVDFSVTLERVGCLGKCPDYKVTISRNGAVLYEGHSFVHAKGEHRHTIPVAAVDQFVRTLRGEDFFHWNENNGVCVDAPQIRITVRLNGQEKRVLQGCNFSDRVLHLAHEIETTSGAKRWIGRWSLK